jgi:hypothetical protein
MRNHRIVFAMLASTTLAGAALAQQPPTEVAPLESVRTMVPVPKVGSGAPYYSSEQLEAERKQANRNIGCIGNDARRRTYASYEFGNGGFYGGGSAAGYALGQRGLYGASGYGYGYSFPGSRSLSRYANSGFDRQSQETRIAFHARKAANATLAAEDARKKAAQGLISAVEVERTELLRQAAVRYYDTLLGRDFGLGYDPSLGVRSPVSIEVASATIRERNGREMIQVTGRIVNTRDRQTRIPTVTLAVYDLDGNLTMATAAQASTKPLAPAEARPFAIEIPAWKDAAKVEVRPGMLAPFQGDRDFCRSGAGRSPLEAAGEYEALQDNLRFNLPPGGRAVPNSAPIRRRP